ncbi:hypothetical protein CI102_5197 [Trichoderma harzianum]|nr:hypothetical protein CI102_5197 [Trichoderma harzianum]
MQPPSCSNTPVLLVSDRTVFFFSSLFYCVFFLSVVLSWNRPAAAIARDEARAGRHNLHHRSRYLDETSHLCTCKSQYLSHPFTIPSFLLLCFREYRRFYPRVAEA